MVMWSLWAASSAWMVSACRHTHHASLAHGPAHRRRQLCSVMLPWPCTGDPLHHFSAARGSDPSLLFPSCALRSGRGLRDDYQISGCVALVPLLHGVPAQPQTMPLPLCPITACTFWPSRALRVPLFHLALASSHPVSLNCLLNCMLQAAPGGHL